MNHSIILPFLVFFPMLGGIIGYIIGRKNKNARDYWAMLVTLLTFGASLLLIGKEEAFRETGICGLGLLFAGGGLQVILAVLTGAIWFITTIYSKEYFQQDRNRNRYYLFMLLTEGATMGIFLSADFFTTFIFFEIMSFTSFVMVMHDETKEAMRAAHTYLAVAVLGGLVTLMGLFMLYQKTGTLQMDLLQQFMAQQTDKSAFYGIGVLVFFGFAAKAGLFPLHIWLPNAYTLAPAPASALLSCLLTKTGVFGIMMITAKIFFHDAPWGNFMLILGMITMLMGAILALFSINLKRTLACSSMSQIGFMMVALGVCTSMNPHEGGLGYMASMFHLFTHAMFKALLFLGAGSIIHAVHSNEMSAMGGLRKYMPITHWTFLIACLAIAGIPPFSGFFSKDEILAACFQYSSVMGWVMTVIAAMTAFYMFRLYYGIFWGKENKELHAHHTPHESPLAMTFPLMFLAAVTCGAGFIPFGHFISSNGESYSIHLDPSVAITSVVIAIISIAIATWMYKNAKQPVADSLAQQFKGLHKAAYHRFYIDEIYQFITHKIIFRCISTPIAWWDRHVVDGFFDFLAWATNATSDEIRGLQSGQVQQYAYVFLCGALALILLLIL